MKKYVKTARGKDAGIKKSMNTRQFVLKILTDFDTRPGDLERLTDKALSQKRIEHRDRRFVFELVFGVIRNRIYLDYVIDRFIANDRELKLDNVRRILQMGAYQILFLDRVPDHAAVNEAVDLVKKDKNVAHASGLVNAILRNIIKNKFTIELPDPRVDLARRLSVEFSHPKWMVERWLSRYGLSNTKKNMAFNNERPAIYLRRSRTSSISRQQFEVDVRTLCEPGSGYMNLYYKMKKSLDLENLRLLKSGFCTIQAPSSGWAVALLGLASGDRVIDLCAAPGGKTTLIAEIIGDSGMIAACDRSRWKMRMIAEIIDKLNLKNIYPIVCDSVRPPLTRKFGKVLLDAPCTGSGVLQRHPDGRFVRTADDVVNMQRLQRELLDSAVNLVDDGGVIVYSTCSLEPEENEHQVEWFLSKYSEFRLDAPPDVIPAMYIDDSNCLRITPFEHGVDGMFGARFKKSSKQA
jgi:16S rRNA (cytosine967-C5)-methyltransferase